MADLSKKLKMEDLDDQSFVNDQQQRLNFIASMSKNSPADKSIHRQMNDNNIARNFLEKMLRKVNTINPTAAGNPNTFGQDEKKDLQEDLRAALLQNYECKAFLKVANELGYQAAESFQKASNSDDSAEDDQMKKRLEEVRKLYAGTPKNANFQKPKMQQQFQPSMRPQRFYGFAPQLPVGTQIPQMQYGGQVAHSTQFQPQLYSAPQANFGTYPQLQPQFNSFAGPKPVRGRFPRPPSTNVTARARHAWALATGLATQLAR